MVAELLENLTTPFALNTVPTFASDWRNFPMLGFTMMGWARSVESAGSQFDILEKMNMEKVFV